LHPLESAALSRRTPKPAIPRGIQQAGEFEPQSAGCPRAGIRRDHRVRKVGFLEKWDYGKGVGVQEKWRNNPMHCEMT
jgi:hypothetical protein